MAAPPLRILHVTPYGPDAWAYGGIPRIAGALTQTFAARGHRVTVCMTDVCDADRRLPLSAAHTRDSPIRYRVFRNVSNRLAYRHQLFWPMGLSAFMRRHARDFDIAHLHACRNMPGVVAASHLRRAGIPFVLVPNGTAARIERRQTAKRVFDALWGNRMMKAASRIVAVSDAERAQLTAGGVPPRLLRVVPNPIDVDEFRGPLICGAFRRQFAIGAGPLVLFLGKLTPRKRVDVLVEAFARIAAPTATLVVAGNDMGAGASLRALATARGVDTRTRFVGLLEGAARVPALADADIVVYASEHEAFGLVPLEAILAGTPVIVGNDSGCGEIIAAVGGGDVIETGSADALARALTRALTSGETARAAARAAAVRVRATYAAGVVCDQLEGVYRDCIAGTRR
jgi:glycosyltransferase involved in cell wall biosynthesis